MIQEILGPIISTKDIQSHKDILESVFGLRETARQTYTESETEKFWGTTGCSCELVWLNTFGTLSGVLLVQFDPSSDESIRQSQFGYDYNALKVIDFYAPDFSAGLDALQRNGFQVRDDIAEYDLPEGRFCEAHFWGPDDVVYAVVSGPKSFMGDIATVTDRTFSEVMSVSGPILDTRKVSEFYASILGLDILHTYGITDESFGRLLGGAIDVSISATNIGTNLKQPHLGLIDYGLQNPIGSSLQDKARAPSRGLLGLISLSRNLDQIKKNAPDGLFSAGPGTASIFPGLGMCSYLGLNAPNGALNLILCPQEG